MFLTETTLLNHRFRVLVREDEVLFMRSDVMRAFGYSASMGTYLESTAEIDEGESHKIYLRDVDEYVSTAPLNGVSCAIFWTAEAARQAALTYNPIRVADYASMLVAMKHYDPMEETRASLTDHIVVPREDYVTLQKDVQRLKQEASSARSELQKIRERPVSRFFRRAKTLFS